MLRITVTIGRVDMNGFCGRDHHPLPLMEGQDVQVHSITTWCEDGLEPLRPLDQSQNHGDMPFTVLEGITPDGVLVQLMEHEIIVGSVRMELD